MMLLGPRIGGMEPEMSVYMSGLTVPLSGVQKYLINQLIRDLKLAVGVNKLSDAFDVIKLYANETIEAGLRNIVKNAHHSTRINSPAFIQYEGFRGNGTDAYIDSNYNPSIHNVNFQLNSGSYGIYFRELERTTSAKYNGAFDLTANGELANRVMVGTNFSTNNFIGINSSATGYADSTTPAVLIGNRTSATSVDGYVNRTKTPLNFTSTKIPSQTLYTLAIHNGLGTASYYNNSLASFEFVGKGFNENQINDIITAIEKYMDYRGKGILM